ncbi:MAG: hypothetical protein ACP5RN_11630 [Armatimonadota bacterium]
MRTPRGCKIGCLTALLIAVIVIVLAIWWWTAPIDIPRPQRPPEPADNPYDVYRSLAAYTAQIFRTDPMLSLAERELFPSRQTVSLHRPELARYLLQQMQPVRLEYRRHLHKPCAVIMEYTPAWQFPELAEFRRWANIEALDMVMAAQEGDYSRVVDDYRTTLLLAEQVRTQGLLIHYVTSSSMQAVVNRQMAELLSRLPARQCEQLVQVIREWEKKRVPLAQMVRVERESLLALLHDLYAGGYDALRTLSGSRSLARWNPRWLNLRRAAREVDTYLRRVETETSKPLNQWQYVEEPQHPVTKMLLPAFEPLMHTTGYVVCRIRLLGCAAAVRAYRLRHGVYPTTLDEAGAADLNKDPFTGGTFVYRPAQQGFLLYSMGEDGVDDGGKRTAERWRSQGDVALFPFDARQTGDPTKLGEPVWLR